MAAILWSLLPERADDAADRIPSFSCISTSLSTIVGGLALQDLVASMPLAVRFAAQFLCNRGYRKQWHDYLC
jgi:hypothetical protein